MAKQNTRIVQPCGREAEETPPGRRDNAGVYCLLLWLPRATRLGFGRRGRCHLDRGWYVYTGSAKRNLASRLARHLRRWKRLHWHIDRLRAVARIREVWVWPWTPGGECKQNGMVRELPGGTYPARGFGASDCRCYAHLVAFPFQPAPPGPGAPLRYRRGVAAVSMSRRLPNGSSPDCSQKRT